MNRDEEPKSTQLEAREESAFDQSVEHLDGRTRSRSNQARQAVAEIEGKGAARIWGPLAGLAAAAFVLLVMLAPLRWTHDAIEGEAVTPLEDIDIVADADHLDLLEDLDFYVWLDGADAFELSIQPAPAEGTSDTDRAVTIEWNELTDPERQVLANFQKVWGDLPLVRRQALVIGARRWVSMTPETRREARARFDRWQQLSTEERREIRLRDREFQELPQDQQRRIRDNFRRFRALPPDRRQELQERWRALPPAEREQIREQLRRNREAP